MSWQSKLFLSHIIILAKGFSIEKKMNLIFVLVLLLILSKICSSHISVHSPHVKGKTLVQRCLLLHVK